MKELSEFSFRNEPGKTLEKECKTEIFGKNMIPRISIITPYFNSDQYLQQTFCCIMNQTFEEFEWLIIDDGSRDKAKEVLKTISQRDCRIRILEQKNQGQSVAKNLGIRESRADIIVFLDADDLIEPFYLEILYKALEVHKAAAWSYTDLVGFGAQQYIWCKPFSAGRMTFNNTLVNSAAFRKEALIKVGCFPEKWKHYDEDWALYLKLMGNGFHPVHVPVIGFWYRRSDSGMQQTVRKSEELRTQSDEFIKQLAQKVDIHITGEQYCDELPENSVRTHYSRKEVILTWLMSGKTGLKLIKSIYSRQIV